MSEEKKSLYCSQCGSEQNLQAKFCTNCGNKLEHEVQTEIPVEATANHVEPIGTVIPDPVIIEPVTPEAVVPEAGIPETVVQPETVTPSETVAPAGGNSQSYANIPTEVVSLEKPRYTEQPNYRTQTPPPVQPQPGNGNIGISIASMVCGILSIVCCCLSYIGVVLAIVAVVLGIVSVYNKYDGRGMAIAGIVLGSIFAVIYIIIIVIWGVGSVAGILGDMMYDY